MLLSQGDPPAVRVENAGASAPFLIVCDHAGCAVPARLAGLGAPAEVLERHVGQDIGAGAVTLALARALGATAVLQTYSRLVIDCNRDPRRADSIVTVADGIDIPGNRGLVAEDTRARVEAVFDPYHAEIARQLDLKSERGESPVLVAIHSFTPELDGKKRPWRFGVLHDGVSAFSAAMLTLLRERSDSLVGDNEPYAMDGVDFTVPHHAGRRGLDFLELEIRQDVIAAEAGQMSVATLLAELLPVALVNAGLQPQPRS